MKIRIATVLSLFLVTLTACKSPPVNRDGTTPLQSVASLDLDRYLGRWFEIARFPNSFEEGCVGVTATYAKKPDGTISVTNRCRQKSMAGEEEAAIGTARIVDPVSNAKLKVTFFWPFEGDYWVIDLADDYTWALVGEPSGRYLWILAREPEISADMRKDLVNRLRAMGYNIDALYWTPHR